LTGFLFSSHFIQPIMTAVSIFWFRRDLRLTDNAGLYQALRGPHPVLPIFIFDTCILDQLEDRSDRRVAFIHAALNNMQRQLTGWQSSLQVHVGDPVRIFPQLLKSYTIGAVYTNHDYEPYALQRDTAVAALLAQKGIAFHTFKDQVILEKQEVVKDDGKPYTVFTPYSRKWKARLSESDLASFETAKHSNNFHRCKPQPMPTLKDIGFNAPDTEFPSPEVDDALIRHYAERRDIPSITGTSRLGIHLRFGTISIRELGRRAQKLSPVFLNELIWRDFYQAILHHFPHVGQGRAFKPEYERIPWRNNEAEFERWCNGTTGYPIVDAGMRELNTTGFMHNRVRMITASFLTKHLLIDWRWGEAYFAAKLLDFDLAANNGGWQWAAGSGVDAAPYFRIFNPWLQTKRFDPELKYVSRWVPEHQEFGYPAPIVEHELARKRCLTVYGSVLGKS
jgi:deoxyribodipyrimidine photo-lyase